MSMTLYLIAHKVRGEPAFDIAEQFACPLCDNGSHSDDPEVPGSRVPCSECDGLGYWWIIPTSGHRAYPWWYTELERWDVWEIWEKERWPMPADLPDHYAANDRNLTLPITDSVRARLGLGGPVHKVVRRL